MIPGISGLQLDKETRAMNGSLLLYGPVWLYCVLPKITTMQCPQWTFFCSPSLELVAPRRVSKSLSLFTAIIYMNSVPGANSRGPAHS